MHEAHLARDLVRQALAVAGPGPVESVHVRIGALAAESAAHLREHFALAAAGTVLGEARLVVDHGTDPADQRALGVVLTAIDVAGRDC